MPEVERVTVTITSKMDRTLREIVAGGEYASASEVVREALRDWMRNRDAERRDLEAMRAAIRAGLNSGPGVPADQGVARSRDRYTAKT